eukprot:7437350-Pyramimonas_sp.AAC.1
MGPRSAAVGAGGACEFRHCDLRWNSSRPRSAVLGDGRGNRLRVAPLGPTVELLIESQNVALGAQTARELQGGTTFGEFQMGPQNTAVGAGTACEFRR